MSYVYAHFKGQCSAKVIKIFAHRNVHPSRAVAFVKYYSLIRIPRQGVPVYVIYPFAERLRSDDF